MHSYGGESFPTRTRPPLKRSDKLGCFSFKKRIFFLLLEEWIEEGHE